MLYTTIQYSEYTVSMIRTSSLRVLVLTYIWISMWYIYTYIYNSCSKNTRNNCNAVFYLHYPNTIPTLFQHYPKNLSYLHNKQN